jgi:hypothetical protein
MDILNKDVIFLIGMKLELCDLRDFCRCCKYLYNLFNSNRYFWILKLKRDYLFEFNGNNGNPKHYYQFIYWNTLKKGFEKASYLYMTDLMEYYLRSMDLIEAAKFTSDKWHFKSLDFLICKLLETDYFDYQDLKNITLDPDLRKKYKKYLIGKKLKELLINLQNKENISYTLIELKSLGIRLLETKISPSHIKNEYKHFLNLPKLC